MTAMARYAQANPSTAQTNAALITAKEGRVCILDSVYISSDTALTVSLVDSATHSLQWRQYVGATGGQLAEGGGLAESLVGEGFDLTTSDTGNVFIKVKYHYSDD